MFKLDANAARAADVKSTFINETGKYIGAFTRAEWMEKKETGSTGIGFSFKSNAGLEAQIYVGLSYKKDGRMEINEGGQKTLNAIMACLRLREVSDPVTTQVEKWDNVARAAVKVSVPCFPQLMNKPIGLLIQMEIEKNSEKGTPRPIIYAPFSPEDNKTASEVLNQSSKSELVEKMLTTIMAKPLIDRRSGGTRSSASGEPAPTGREDSFEDDLIPF